MVNVVLTIDEKNGNILWQDAIAKELENVKNVFQAVQNSDEAPIYYQYDICNIINIKVICQNE